MRTSGSRLELGVELAPDEPWMRLQLHHLDQRAVRRQPAQVEPMLDELITVFVVDFIAMAMPLAHLWRAVDRSGLCSDAKPAWVRSEAHGATHVGDVLLVFHQG